MNLIALLEFNLDFVIPNAAKNLLLCCAIAHAQAAWRSPHPQSLRGRRDLLREVEIFKAPYEMALRSLSI